MDENRLVELETRIAYQDLTISDLNAVLIGLRATVDTLAARLKRAEEQLHSGGGSHIRSMDEETPPPHY